VILNRRMQGFSQERGGVESVPQTGSCVNEVDTQLSAVLGTDEGGAISFMALNRLHSGSDGNAYITPEVDKGHP